MKPPDLRHVRKNEIIRYWDIHKYILGEENIRTHGGKQKLQNSMEPMLPQSLVLSDSDRMSFGDCERRNPQSQSLS